MGNITGIQILPHILTGPFNNWVQGMHAFYDAGFKQSSGFIIVIHQLYVVFCEVVQFQQTAVIFPADAFLPADTGNDNPSPASPFLEFIAAIAHLPRGRHPLFHNELPHGHVRLVYDHIRVTLPNEVDHLRGIHCCQAVMRIEFDTSLLAQVINTLAILSARESKKIPIRRFKGFYALDGNFHFVLNAEHGFFHKHLYKSTAFLIADPPLPFPV